MKAPIVIPLLLLFTVTGTVTKRRVSQPTVALAQPVGGCNGDYIAADPTTLFEIDENGPIETTKMKLKGVSFATGLDNVLYPSPRPREKLIDWGNALSFVKSGTDVCDLDTNQFSATRGRLVAVVYISKDASGGIPLQYLRWLWVDRWQDKWRGVLIDIADHTNRKPVPLELVTEMGEWPTGPSYSTEAGAWRRHTKTTSGGVTEIFDRVQVMLGPISFLATTSKLDLTR